MYFDFKKNEKSKRGTAFALNGTAFAINGTALTINDQKSKPRFLLVTINDHFL